MRSRVIPGSLVTMERRLPVRRLNSVDLPTLGRPTITSDGSFSDMFCLAGRTERLPGGGATFQCSAFAAQPVEKEERSSKETATHSFNRWTVGFFGPALPRFGQKS